jgi:aspartate-semialdehyde dehydrogenase
MHAISSLRVGLVGATGAVGEEVLSILASRGVPPGALRLFASERSRGKSVPFGEAALPVQVLEEGCFDGLDAVLFTAGASVSHRWVPEAVAAGAYGIDNTSQSRLDADIPLVVPEINGALLPGTRSIAAVPNCAAVQLVMVLHPLHKAVGLRSVRVATYQSVSGGGKRAMAELADQSHAFLHGKDHPSELFPHPIAFNCIPQIPQCDAFGEDGFTVEETKIMQETRKILEDDRLRISATCVRVPVYRAHGEAVFVETERPCSVEQARELLAAAPGVCVADDPGGQRYPMPREAAGRDEVFVGRIRRDPASEQGLALWIVGDNLRKGAALNAVQILEALAARGVFSRGKVFQPS